MTNQIQDVRTLPAYRPIMRPLPAIVGGEACLSRRDATTARILFEVDDSWFAAYWYGVEPHPKLHALGQVVRRVWSQLMSVRLHTPARPVCQNDRAVVKPNLETGFVAIVAAGVALSIATGSALALSGMNGAGLNMSGMNGIGINGSGLNSAAVVDLNSLRLLRAAIRH